MLTRLLLAAAAAILPAAAVAAPKVVASVVPVHALVAGVMEGVGEPTLLVGGNASPHDYALRPSEARLVADAELLFWIGPELEAFLTKPVAALGEGKAVELLDVSGIERLPTREGGVWESHDEHADHGTDDHAHDDHGHDDHGHDDHADEQASHAGHDHGEIDSHIWLGPHNAQAMVAAIADRLAAVDPANEAAYRANAERLSAEIEALDAELAAKLAPVQNRPFIVFHDAYQYFESHYDLNGAGAITVDPERRPGARRIQEIRDRVRELEAVCVFAEPQFEPALVSTIAEGTGARTGTLDPEGAGGAEGRDAYFHLMRQLADSLVACLDG